MPKRRKSIRKKNAGFMANKMLLAAIVGIIIIGGGIASYYLMSDRDAVSWDSASEVIRDRTRQPAPSVPSDPVTTEETNETSDDNLVTNPIQMNLFGIDVDGVRHPVPESSAYTQSAYLGDVEIFDVEFDVYFNYGADIDAHPERYASGNDVVIMIMLSLVDRYVADTVGNVYSDSYDSGMVYPDVFTYNVTIPGENAVGYSAGYVTLSMMDDLFGSFAYTDINDVDNAVFTDARSVGLMNQEVVDNTTVAVEGMLTFQYAILGYYTVNDFGSDANRALQRLTITTEPYVETGEEVPDAGAMSVYSIGGLGISGTTLMIVGLGVFSMIMVYYYLSRRR